MKIDRCEIKECRNLISLDNHHIHSLSKGGPDIKWNKCKICPNCHRNVHSGNLIIEGRFDSTGGNIIVYRKKGEESISQLPDPPVWLYSDNKKVIGGLFDAQDIGY